MSPSPPTYESYKKLYLTTANLYMRYALLSKPQAHNKTTRLIMFIQDLYKMFYNKEKSIIFTSSKILYSPTNRNATFDYQKSPFKCSNSIVKTPFFIITKLNAQKLITQQQRHMRFIKHDARIDICINNVRKHTISPVDLAVADQIVSRFYTLTSQQRKSLTDSYQDMQRSNKI